MEELKAGMSSFECRFKTKDGCMMVALGGTRWHLWQIRGELSGECGEPVVLCGLWGRLIPL